MSCLVSSISTLRALGPVAGFLGLWLQAWITSWLVAFPSVLVAAPLARRMARAVIERMATPETRV